MSKRRRIAPGQLSLNLWGETTDSADKVSQPELHSSTSGSEAKEKSVRESATTYSIPVATSQSARSYQPQSQPTESNSDAKQLPQIFVYVGITFDPCQGIREVKQNWIKNQVPSEVVFDCRHLELAPLYASKPKQDDEFFSPEQKYLLGRGGFVNTAIFINVLRCYETLDNWSRDVRKETGTRSIRNFKFIRPDPETPIGKLWDIMGMEGLTERQHRNLWESEVEEFQSRIVTPLLWVDSSNRNHLLSQVDDWLDYISKRLNPNIKQHLWVVTCEVLKNLVDHGHQGIFAISIWPSGQIEIVWSNPIDHLASWWPPNDNVKGLANSLLASSGRGMPYIYDELLPNYDGVLIIHWKTHHLVFCSAGEKKSDEQQIKRDKAISFSISGLKPRSNNNNLYNNFLPRSILFHLHLFCQDTRDRSSANVDN